MSLKTDIQKQLTEAVQGGTFPRVEYDSSDLPAEGASKTPGSVVCNELSSGLSDSARYGATQAKPVYRNWRWEVVAEWTCEVDVSYFIENELSMNFNLDSLLVSVIPSGDFQVTHPPRNASHNGTKVTLGLTVNTRR